MEELKDITNVIGNLFRARAFTLMSDQPSKESTAKALEGSIRRSLDTGDGLQYGLVEANDAAQGIMSVADSESLVNYLSLRRDVLNLLTRLTRHPKMIRQRKRQRPATPVLSISSAPIPPPIPATTWFADSGAVHRTYPDGYRSAGRRGRRVGHPQEQNRQQHLTSG